MKNTVSVIIPSYNSYKTIEYTLKGVLRQPNGLVKEVIVVDSSADKITRPLLSRYASRGVKLIEANAGPAVARNIGVKDSTGNILVFLDSDAYPADDWAEKIVIAYDSGCMMGGGSIGIPDFQRYKMIALAQLFLQYNEFLDAGPARIKKIVPSVTMFCDRKLFERFNGFPTIRAAEDTLFCLTVGREVPVWFVPQIKVRHIFREKMISFLKNQVLLGKYIIVYRRIYEPAAFYYKGLWPLIFLPGFLLVKVFRINLRMYKCGAALLLRYIYSMPLFMLGLLCWTGGFMSGIFSDKHKTRK
jgi:glycosyltransferase involved in cell wall biosynthesis